LIRLTPRRGDPSNVAIAFDPWRARPGFDRLAKEGEAVGPNPDIRAQIAFDAGP
jgi:hypothetical protein